MDTTQLVPDETKALRRCLRELAALSTLSAVWGQNDVREIAEGLCRVLCRCLPAVFTYVRVSGHGGTVAAEVAGTQRGPVPADHTREISESLEPLLKTGSSDQIPIIVNPFGTGTLRLAVIPLGYEGDCGVLVAGSQQPDFPSQTDRLVLGVGANQAAIVLQQKRAEEQIRASERELADFFDNATIGLHWVGPDGIILRANRADLELLGYSSDEYVGHHVAEFHADKDVFEDMMRRLLAGEGVRDYEARMRCKDGSIKHVLIDSSVLWKDGQFVHTRTFTRDVTGRRLEQEALLRLAAIVESSDDTILSIDWNGTITSWNRAGERLFGYTAEEIIGRPISILIPPDHQDDFPTIMERLGRGERVEHYETERLAKDGRRVDVSLTVSPIRNAAGKLIGVSKIARDITDRKRAEEATSRLAAIVESSDDAIVGKNLDGIITSWNRGAEHMFGYTAQETIGQPVTMLMPPERVDEGPSILQRIRRGEKIDHYETIRRRKDGTLLTISLSISPVFDSHGKIIGASKIARDITRRKQAEERLRLLWDVAVVLLSADSPDPMLRGLLARIGPHLGVDVYFNYLVNDSGDALRLASCDGIAMDAARQITRLEFGQAICGRVARERRPIAVAHIQRSNESDALILKSFGIRAYVCNPLIAGDRLLGTLSFGSRIKDQFDPEEVAFLETLCHYVTVASERLRLLNELKEADRRKDEFLATLAHELRNPLAPVRNAVQVLRLKGPDQPELRWGRDVIDRQIEHLTRLIDDLLDISRITRNKLELRKQRVELAEVIRGAVESSRPLIDQCGHELTVTLPPQPIYLNGDIVRLSQVFLNLLNNAAKYTEGRGRIWLTAEQQGSEVVVRVEDTGVGIPAEKLPRLFDIFFQVDQTMGRSQGGLGIGLSLVRRLVELHGGTVEAHSEGIGKGSEFIVRLPVLLEKPRPAHSQESSGNGVQPTTARRILLVDDNRDAADSLAMLLRLTGNEVHTAYDGVEGVEAAQQFRPEVVLLDIGMPKLNGEDACRRIRSEPWGEDMVLIALTGWGQEEDRRRSKEAGFDHHMTKPVDPTALTKLLAERQPKAV